MKPIDLDEEQLYRQVTELLATAKQRAIRQFNRELVQTYFEVGRMIIEFEQRGRGRADYGKAVIRKLSARLNEHFGRGFSVGNLTNMRRFYRTYRKSQTVSAISSDSPFQLSWSHYVRLIRIDSWKTTVLRN